MRAEPPAAGHTNRLASEKSPYLLQHADNPVDWYPWGEEAFEKARREDKPVFLSIGYSTCHWCHVMERESFEDPQIAAVMNAHFVSIKVDREERPDVDHFYMQAVMAMTGRGGWPLSVFLTPEGEPFYGGTYFPPRGRLGQPGFKTILEGLADAWKNRRQEVVQSGGSLVEALRGAAKAAETGGEMPGAETLAEGYRRLEAGYDGRFAGFLPAPKFPRPPALSFLLRHHERTGEEKALRMTEATLDAMAAGGIRDHLGGGFHRYSTDAQWRVPHFEKMLYDQALLSIAYLEAYQATGHERHAAQAREIFEYVLRDLTSPEGGFYSAEDADSKPPEGGPEKKEGAFYLWTFDELTRLLGSERAALFAYLYGAAPQGNALHDPLGEFSGKNILYRAHTDEEAAQKFNLSPEEVRRRVEESRRILLEARRQRPRPHLDDKVLTDWNGLMISALAVGSRVLDDPRYARAAERAARFIRKTLVRKDGRLLHRYRDGEAAIPGHLEDYAFLIHGLVDLYQATFDPVHLEEAKRLTGEMIALFWDETGGGFYIAAQETADGVELPARLKEIYDGAIPSGNSVAALDLLRVGRMTFDRELEARAETLFKAFAAPVKENPEGYPQLLIALDFALGPSREIVLAGAAGDPALEEMTREVFCRFLPNQVVLFHPADEGAGRIEALAPFLKAQAALEGKATAYVCENYACKLPVTDPARLAGQLENRP